MYGLPNGPPQILQYVAGNPMFYVVFACSDAPIIADRARDIYFSVCFVIAKAVLLVFRRAALFAASVTEGRWHRPLNLTH